MKSVWLRLLLKIFAVIAVMTAGMPLAFTVTFAFDLLSPLSFLQPVVGLLAFGLLAWAVVEAVRRVGKPPKDETAVTISVTKMDEADLRLVLDSKDAIGELRTLSEAMDGAAPATQLLGLSAVADGVLNSLPQVPQALDAARPLLVFYLPRVVAAAERLPQPFDTARDGAANRLAHAAALLGNALRASRTGAGPADLVKLDYAVQALNVSFGRRLAAEIPVRLTALR
jgi:hypothetical protein